MAAPGATTSGVPKLEKADIQLVYADGYWDGPLSGLATYRSELHRFELASEAEDVEVEGWYRRYWLLKLTDSQTAFERAVHRLFQQHVGTHMDYG